MRQASKTPFPCCPLKVLHDEYCRETKTELWLESQNRKKKGLGVGVKNRLASSEGKGRVITERHSELCQKVV